MSVSSWNPIRPCKLQHCRLVYLQNMRMTVERDVPNELLHAGYETTSTAISYALYEIARNTLVQQKLQAEVDAFGREREPSFDDLSSFPYAEAVFHEGMRLHPPVTPFIALVSGSCILLAWLLWSSRTIHHTHLYGVQHFTYCLHLTQLKCLILQFIAEGLGLSLTDGRTD